MFNLNANAEVDDISIVPEDFRPLYKQSEKGTFIHNADLASTIKAISGMQGVNTKLRTDLDTVRKSTVKLDALKDWGDTPEAIAETVRTKMAELEAANKSSGKIDVEKARQEIMAAADAKIKEAETKSGRMRSSLENVMIDREAYGAIASAKGEPDLLLPFVKQNVRVVEDGDDYRAVVVDAQGNTRLNPATGQNLTVAELVNEMKADKKYSRLFESEAPSGGNLPPQQKPTGAPNTGAMSSINKISAGLANRAK